MKERPPLAVFAAFLLLVCKAAVPDDSHSDASALVQRNLVVSSAGSGADMNSTEALGWSHAFTAASSVNLTSAEVGQLDVSSAEVREAMDSALKSFSRTLSDELGRFEEEQNSELETVHEIHQYVHQLKATFGRYGTAFGQMIGLAPAGKMSQADERVLATLLVPFRSQKFVQAVVKGLKKLSYESRKVVWRSETQTAALVRKSGMLTEKEVRAMLDDYFSKEKHILESLITTANDVAINTLEAAPISPITKGIWLDLIKKGITRAHTSLAQSIGEISKTNFTSYCGERSLGIFIFQQVLPITNRTASALPNLVNFARNKVPDVAPQVQEAATWLQEILENFVASVDGEVQIWFEKICGLAGAVADLPQW